MRNLASLPLEIRDKIITLVLVSPSRDVPRLPAAREPIKGMRTYKTPNLDYIDPWLVKYRPNKFVATSTPLLVLNRQFHAETTSCLQRLGRKAHVYDLDIIIHNEIDLVPTWLKVPKLTTEVEAVNVTFRIAGEYSTEDPSHRFLYGRPYPPVIGFMNGRTRRGPMMWQLFAVLERFMLVGPTGEPEGDDKSRGVIIKNLNINVETPPGVREEQFWEPRSSWYWRSPDTGPHKGLVLDPKFFAKYLSSSLDLMTWRRVIRAYMPRVDCYYRCLDQVLIKLDGEEHDKHDISEELAVLLRTEGIGDDLEQWAHETLRERAKKGLRISQSV